MKYLLILIFSSISLAVGDEESVHSVGDGIDLLAIPIEDPVRVGPANEEAEQEEAHYHRHGENCDDDCSHADEEVFEYTVGDPLPDDRAHCDHDGACNHNVGHLHSDVRDHSSHDHHSDQGHHEHSGQFWDPDGCGAYTTDDPNLGGFLFPSLSFYGAFGGSSGNQEELASGHHDPQGNATLQSLEPSLTLHGGQVRGFVTGSGYTDAHGEFDFTIEEAYLGLDDLPGRAGVRGGRFLNPFGFQNARHNHAWNFVDQNLVNGRFLNEGEITTEGGEIVIPVVGSSRVRAYYGGVASHDHHHHHEEEEFLAFEGDGAEIQDRMFGVTVEGELRFDDRRSVAAVVSGLWGDNAFERHTRVYGGGLEYRTAIAGRPLRIRGEAMFREIDAVAGHLPGEEEDEHEHEEDHDHEEHEEIAGLYHEGDHATFDEFGFSAAILYGLNDRSEIGVRTDWVSGIDEFGMDDRFRISPVLTWYANAERTVQCRLQYNHDISNEFGNENSVWFQVGFNWPGHHAH